MLRTSSEWEMIFRKEKAIWTHNGGGGPHAVLTSGNHAGGYVLGEYITQNPVLLSEATEHLFWELIEVGLRIDRVDRVIGPAMGGVVIAQSLASSITKRRHPNNPCYFSYAEKSEGGNFKIPEGMISPKDKVLIVDDVVTLGGTIDKVREAINARGGIVLPFFGALVDRGQNEGVASLFRLEVSSWLPHECPLCRKGSEAIKPGEEGNWGRLVSGSGQKVYRMYAR